MKVFDVRVMNQREGQNGFRGAHEGTAASSAVNWLILGGHWRKSSALVPTSELGLAVKLMFVTQVERVRRFTVNNQMTRRHLERNERQIHESVGA